MTLDEVLAPIGMQSFLDNYVGQHYLHVEGPSGRFERLVPWSELNEGLARLRANDDRIFLVRQGRRLPADAYLRTSRTGRIQFLNGPAVVKYIRDGATLVVNQVDEFITGVTRLAESCEELFHGYVAANLYAGWRTDPGFDIHWDAHDTLIVQIHGSKDWRVWRPTREQPLPGEGPDIVKKPTDSPCWESTIRNGDMLYIPRGWWHVAMPRDEPSVHVTFGLNHQTGKDLLEWMVRQAQQTLQVRMNMPHWTSPSEQRAWLHSIREACTQGLSDDAISSYLDEVDAMAHTRPIVRLPRTTSKGGQIDIASDAALRLWRGRRLTLRKLEGESNLAFTVDGRTWQCDEALGPALRLLNHVRPCTLAEMSGAIDRRARPLLLPFVTLLIAAEVVWAEPEIQTEPVSTFGV
jgi:Cupin superfamily protein